MRIKKEGYEELVKMDPVKSDVILCTLLNEFSKIYLNVTVEWRVLYLFYLVFRILMR